MTIAAPSAVTGTNAQLRRPGTGADAARYSVLRRLAPALKHDMVVNLQAVSMMAEVLNARLEKATPSPAEFQKSVSKINRLARDAVTACLKVTAWIEPSEDRGIQLYEGVDECVSLLQSSFNFRGFSIRNEVPETEFEVSHVALRNLLAASLLTLTDGAEGPCELAVKAEISAGWAVLTVECLPSENEAEEFSFDPVGRELDWADIQALAIAESVELSRMAEQITMRMQRLVATTPLQIVPV